MTKVAAAPRSINIDALRGLAVLGILVMNVQSFAMVSPAYMNPTAWGDLSGANHWVWRLSHLLADLKFISLFSMLFGAGIIALGCRQEQQGLGVIAIHYRRMAWLACFGIVHAYVLWHGDILVPYAICGAILVWARNWQPRTQFVVGMILIAVASIFFLIGHFALPLASAEQMADMRQEWSIAPPEVQRRAAILRGPWLGQTPLRAKAALSMETYIFAVFTFWRAGGCMLLGMALYRWGFLDGRRSTQEYVQLLLIGLIGIPIIEYGTFRNFSVDWDLHYSFLLGSQYNYWGSLLVAMAYLAIVNLACKTSALNFVSKTLAALGRLALTNYLAQSLICSFVFYGHGAGMYCRLSRVQQFQLVVIIWLIQCAYSVFWVRYFHLGPMEWLWRSLVNKSHQTLWKK